MPLANIGLRFDSGLIVGSWDMPNPNTQPEQFLQVANDIGFHVATEIARGGVGCFFVTMPDKQ